MKDNLNSIKFNLTHTMALELILFNKLKRELNECKEQFNLDKNDKLLYTHIQELEKKLELSRKSFIKKFRESNKKEIEEYLNLKDQF